MQGGAQAAQTVVTPACPPWAGFLGCRPSRLSMRRSPKGRALRVGTRKHEEFT